MAFQRATKKKAKLRLALFGPAGAGKTFTALRIAKGMREKAALIDTEHGSASKYADRFEFDVQEMDGNKGIDALISLMAEAHQAEYEILIIDSLSHSWKELLLEVDRLANSKYHGNTWAAWGEGTPKQKKLIEAILNFPGHIIATMRSKTEWVTQDGGNGKVRPQKVGLAPEAGKGIEYEFDMLMELSVDHIAFISKDRTGKFQDVTIEKPDEGLGKQLIEWLQDGTTPPKTDPDNPALKEYYNNATAGLKKMLEEELINKEGFEVEEFELKELLKGGDVDGMQERYKSLRRLYHESMAAKLYNSCVYEVEQGVEEGLMDDAYKSREIELLDTIHGSIQDLRSRLGLIRKHKEELRELDQSTKPKRKAKKPEPALESQGLEIF